MATERQTAQLQTRSLQGCAGAASDGWLSPVHKPAEPDPKKRAAAIKRGWVALIKTTARIDTITLGRD